MAATNAARTAPRSEGATPAPGERHLEPATDAVFLSPRVVDQRAFEDFATQLRELIRDASRVAESLQSAARTGERAGETVGAMFQQHAERIGALKGLVKVLGDHRDSADTQVAQLLEAERRAREAQASLELTAAQVEEQVSAMLIQAEKEQAARTLDADRRDEAAAKRLAALEVRVTIVESLAERVHELAARVERLMEERASRAASDDLADFAANEREAADASATLDEWIHARRDAVAQAEQLLDRMDSATDELSRLLHKGDTLARLLERLTGPQELCAAAPNDASGAD